MIFFAKGVDINLWCMLYLWHIKQHNTTRSAYMSTKVFEELEANGSAITYIDDKGIKWKRDRDQYTYYFFYKKNDYFIFVGGLNNKTLKTIKGVHWRFINDPKNFSELKDHKLI